MCTPPAESCNYVDDDCDGIVDSNLYAAPSASQLKVWTSAGYTPVSDTYTQMFSKPGGFWLMLRVSSGALELRELDELGRAASKRVVFDRTAGLGPFRVASDGKWIVVAIQAGTALQVQLYDAIDGSFVSTTNFGGTKPSCGQLLPTGVGVQDEGGVARIAASRVSAAWATDANGNCPPAPGSAVTGDHEAFFLSYQSGAWSPATTAGLSLPAYYTFVPTVGLSITKSPCRAGWHIAYGGDSHIFRDYATSGTERSRHDNVTSGMTSVTSATAISESCSAGYADWAIVDASANISSDQKTVVGKSSIRILRLDTTTGAATSTRDLALPTDVIWAGPTNAAGGRAFAAALDVEAHVRIYEYSASTPLRSIAISAIGTPSTALTSSQITAAVAFAAGAGIAGLAVTPKAVVVGVTLDKILAGLEPYRDPGDSDPPLAVTYRVGCPD